jgi:hypothetical protein
MPAAWEKQSASLVEVQKRGTGLEATVRKTLRWPNGRIVYDKIHGYKMQIDAAYPNTTAPQIIVSVTYTDPDKRGHSNENKLQLKVGEPALLKAASMAKCGMWNFEAEFYIQYSWAAPRRV